MSQQALDQTILENIHSLNYGSVEVIVHNGKIVQIERKEKIRVEDNKK